MAAVLKGSTVFTRFRFMLLILFVLFSVPLILPISLLSKIVFVVFLLHTLFFSLKFWGGFIPFLQDQSDNVQKILFSLFLCTFQRASSIFFIESGKFDRDYFNIRKKPRIGALFLDSESAVTLVNKKGRKRILFSGLNFIHGSEQVMHVFDLNHHHFQLETNRQKYPLQSVVKLLNNENRAGSSQFQLQSSKPQNLINPSFSIHYNLVRNQDSRNLEETLISLSDHFYGNSISGEIRSHLENLITSSITSFVNRSIMEFESKDIPSTEQLFRKYEEITETMNSFLSKAANSKSIQYTNDHDGHTLAHLVIFNEFHALDIRVFLES